MLKIQALSHQKELHKYVANKKVCLIGGSSNIVGSNMGNYIDDHVVVRANCHWPIPKCLVQIGVVPSHDLTKDIGSKTDILFHGGYNRYNRDSIGTCLKIHSLQPS